MWKLNYLVYKNISYILSGTYYYFFIFLDLKCYYCMILECCMLYSLYDEIYPRKRDTYIILFVKFSANKHVKLSEIQILRRLRQSKQSTKEGNALDEHLHKYWRIRTSVFCEGNAPAGINAFWQPRVMTIVCICSCPRS